jgi:two-component system, chemotaxis family, protein-glutamate methylesterase/glutaminase
MPVRVLVVEDSVSVRERLREILSDDPEIQVVGVGTNGREAIDLCMRLQPDVVTLDMMLPVMSGVAATEFIMAHRPTPILIVSASVNRGELFKTYDALAAGAVDVLEKPRGDEPPGVWERKFVSTVKLVSRIKVITHLRGKFSSPRLTPIPVARVAPAAAEPYRLVALGASTGGPAALLDVLRDLPPTFSVPLVILLHIDEPFGIAFADWLDAQTTHRVAYARDGEAVSGTAGRIVMAPPGRHLIVEHGRFRLTNDKERHSCKPSVDVLFESIARDCGARSIAVLMTGMGRDGAAGLLEIKRAGGYTIAQNEASCVVFGMPREAISLGAASRVLPLDEIAQAIVDLAEKNEARQK